MTDQQREDRCYSVRFVEWLLIGSEGKRLTSSRSWKNCTNLQLLSYTNLRRRGAEITEVA